MNRGVGCPTITAAGSTTGQRAGGPGCPEGFNRYRAATADFFWGRDYVGWAPRGYYSNPGGRHNWDPRYHSSGSMPNGSDRRSPERSWAEDRRGPGSWPPTPSRAVCGRVFPGTSGVLACGIETLQYSRGGMHASSLSSRSTEGCSGRNCAGRPPASHRLQKRHRRRSDPAVVSLNCAQPQFFSYIAGIQRVRHHPRQPQCVQAIRLEFETIETRGLADLYGSVRPILFAIYFPGLRIHQCKGRLPRIEVSGSIGQPCRPILGSSLRPGSPDLMEARLSFSFAPTVAKIDSGLYWNARRRAPPYDKG